MKQTGCIFISHSHNDIEKIRVIRNHLENLGFNPLLFYLKCLSDNDEIADLIKREIDVREWFIYVDSESSRKSKWVQTERDYIENFKNKIVFTIKLDDDITEQIAQIEHIAKQLKVKISYIKADEMIAHQIKDIFDEKDMLTFLNEVSISDEFKDSDVSFKDVWNIIIVSSNSYDDINIKTEIKKIANENGRMFPIYVGEANFTDKKIISCFSYMMYGQKISLIPSRDELEQLIDWIKDRIKYYDTGRSYWMSESYWSAKTIHLPPVLAIDRDLTGDCYDTLQCIYVPDSVIYITPDAFIDHPDILIKCHANTYTEKYCIKNGLRYEIIVG